MIRLSAVCLLIASVAAAEPGKPPFTVAQLKAAWQTRQDRHDKVMAKWVNSVFRPKGSKTRAHPRGARGEGLRRRSARPARG